MKRRKAEDEHENLERWLITYADLITLLLAFFIMMYTFSKQDAEKYDEVSGHLRTIFTGGPGVVKAGSGSHPISLVPMTDSHAEVKRQLENEIQAMAESKTLEQQRISVFRDERGIVLRIMDRAFFGEGKAELKQSAKNALGRIAPILKSNNCQIRIEGHTDDVPINTSEFTSNWELSARRATEVVRHLVEKHGLSPRMMSAAGYAQYRPIVDNDTATNKALNRRIEIILLHSTKPD